MNFSFKATKIALIQSKFHRTIKHRLHVALKPFQLATVDWIVLGFLDHRGKAMVISEVAAELGIQSSFMTTIVNKLLKRRLIIVKDDKVDGRKKYISLDAEGRKVVRLMQRQFEEFFAPLVQGLSIKELATYLKVITAILENAEKRRNI